eukprot:CAMPEP_0178969052 /NCGR_PEP_ID=MMETSP0789-20121207/18616_1 /TAXON_ID=3005 /ORGANISM="Rhizosolenia setigera, Strain CCMP 1694" /LENGTH=148 /DNA_ID=CAMNT_0020655091 /DNA_START=149 /DNA_END=595 /DNA_ORIENTATION=-
MHMYQPNHTDNISLELLSVSGGNTESEQLKPIVTVPSQDEYTFLTPSIGITAPVLKRLVENDEETDVFITGQSLLLTPKVGLHFHSRGRSYVHGGMRSSTRYASDDSPRTVLADRLPLRRQNRQTTETDTETEIDRVVFPDHLRLPLL